MKRMAPLVPYLAVGLGLLYYRNAWAALISYHLGILLFLGFGRAFGHFRRLRPILHPGWAFSAWISACLAGLLLYLGWNGLPLPADLTVTVASLGLTADSWPWFIAYFSLVNPWLEETFWRGWLSGPALAPLPQDFLFSGYHLLILMPFVPWPWLFLALGVLAAAAWFWRQVYRRTGSLFIPAVAHLLADFSILTAISTRTLQP